MYATTLYHQRATSPGTTKSHQQLTPFKGCGLSRPSHSLYLASGFPCLVTSSSSLFGVLNTKSENVLQPEGPSSLCEFPLPSTPAQLPSTLIPSYFTSGLFITWLAGEGGVPRNF
ncbi:hypothetical protein CLAIMM_13165 isoform 2 [Cladophialophora immunda]|nr:hypothetical protein CLAIMM_13165 isoform 2 [Cladophialophora immunda]